MATASELRQLLKEDAAGKNLYDHLTETLMRIALDRPANSYDVLVNQRRYQDEPRILIRRRESLCLQVEDEVSNRKTGGLDLEASRSRPYMAFLAQRLMHIWCNISLTTFF